MSVIFNGVVINEGEEFCGWVEHSGGLITNIGRGEYCGDKTDGVDAKGGYIMPGVIDDQVHFRDPGLTAKGDIQSESRAAAAGGVTSFMEMPNTIPQTTTLENWEWKMERASDVSSVNYSFFMGATNDNLKVISKINPVDFPGVKVFMGSSTGGMLVDNISRLEAIFAECPTLIATHCEDEGMIRTAMDKFGSKATIFDHPRIRNAEACYRSSALAVEIATKYNTRLHVLHLSTQRELTLFENKPLSKKQITNEVCAHHLWFYDKDYKQRQNAIKCNPAIKTKEDRNALREGLLNGKVDIVATDHAPHTIQEKAAEYTKAPSGMPMVQHSLQLLLEMFSPKQVVEYMCHRPALCFGVEKRGYLKVGYWADIVVVAKEEQRVIKEELLYKCGWSPIEGLNLKHKISHTFVNGQHIWNGKELNTTIRGQKLNFNKL